MAETYDLIPEEKACDVFNVQFDLYTPRAHFMILPRNPKERYDKLSEEDKLKLIKLAMSMVSEYNLQKSAILSLHFGSWLSTPNKFHAHICVDVEDYLHIVRQEKATIAKHLPHLERRNKWEKGKNPNDYPMNVRGYPFRTYYLEEVEAIREYRRSPTGESDSSCPHLPLNFLLHPSEPRVGFAVEKSEEPSSCESKFEALEAMINFAEQNNLTNIKSKDDTDGCHVCLVLDGRSNGFSLKEASQILVGFIQVSGLKFYKDFCDDKKNGSKILRRWSIIKC